MEVVEKVSTHTFARAQRPYFPTKSVLSPRALTSKLQSDLIRSSVINIYGIWVFPILSPFTDNPKSEIFDSASNITREQDVRPEVLATYM